MSQVLVSRPQLIRQASKLSSSDCPMAINTCDGSIEPVEQAEPVAIAMLFKSQCIISSSPVLPGIAMFKVLGSLCSNDPLSRYPGICSLSLIVSTG